MQKCNPVNCWKWWVCQSKVSQSREITQTRRTPHFIRTGRYTAYSALKAVSVKPDEKFKLYFIVQGLLTQCWKHHRNAQKTSLLSFRLVLPCEKLKSWFLVPTVKLWLNVEVITNFYFQKPMYLSGYRHLLSCTFLYLPVAVFMNITVPCSIVQLFL